MRWLILLVCVILGYLLVSRIVRPPRRQDPRFGKGGRDGRREDADGGRATTANWHRILGVRENASLEEIRAAYKRAIARNHPDKVAQMDEEIRVAAETRTKQINAAYEIGARTFRKE